MRMVKWLVAFVVLSLCSLGFAQPIKIGYVDVQRVLSESKKGQEAKAKIEARSKELDRQFQQMQQELNSLREEIEKKGSLMSETALKEKQKQFNQKRRQLEQFVSDSQQELQEMERKAVAEILKDVESIIANIGKSKGYTLILEKQRSFILYAPPEIDLTNEVIKALDAKKP
jgi:outer membrane protein